MNVTPDAVLSVNAWTIVEGAASTWEGMDRIIESERRRSTTRFNAGLFVFGPGC